MCADEVECWLHTSMYGLYCRASAAADCLPVGLRPYPGPYLPSFWYLPSVSSVCGHIGWRWPNTTNRYKFLLVVVRGKQLERPLSNRNVASMQAPEKLLRNLVAVLDVPHSLIHANYTVSPEFRTGVCMESPRSSPRISSQCARNCIWVVHDDRQGCTQQAALGVKRKQ
jgi:hypothetical protein